MTTTMLVDANNLAIRAMSAVSKSAMVSDDGTPTGALVVFVNILAKYVRRIRPDLMVIVWDGGHSVYRKGLFAAYKQDRMEHKPENPDSFKLIKDFLSLANIKQVSLLGVEADDIIAYYWNCIAERGDLHIISGDKDFFQLLDWQTTLHRPDDDEPWTVARFEEEHGYHPSEMTKIMALMGDKIDGVPGLPRVGLKTAEKLLEASGWSLETLVELGEVAGIKIDPEVVWRNLSLVDLTRNLPVAFGQVPSLRVAFFRPGANMDGVVKFLDQYQLATLKSKLLLGKLWRDKNALRGRA